MYNLFSLVEGIKLMIRPLADRVVIERTDSEDRTTGGIILPDTVKEKPQQGVILAVGPGRLGEMGNIMPMEVKVGDKVLFQKYSGSEFKEEKTTYLLISEKDILATIE